jgi:anti-sigma regulatory factor (Ser/Thr protein kinase)
MKRDLTFELSSDVYGIAPFVDALVEHATRTGFDHGRLRLNLRVGVTEALSNAMLYGNRGERHRTVTVHASFAREEITVRVSDEGSGFDPERVPDPTTPANRRRARGRGIFLIRQLMDHVEYNDAGNSVEMRLANGPAGPIKRVS